MGRPVTNYDSFLRDFAALAEGGQLYAFLLYSNASGASQIAQFIQQNKELLNDLAVNAGTDLFFFDESLAPPGVNPSAMVAGLFGISLSELPGVVIFSAFDPAEINAGAFFPLTGAGIEMRPESVEQSLGHIFDAVRREQMSTYDMGMRLETLRGHERRLATAERWRRMRLGLGAVLRGMKDLPGVFVENLARGLGEGLAKRG
jgi:hypothetical protein